MKYVQFFIKKEKSILKSSQNIYKLYKNNLSSSGHFLSQGIHEWCHNIHIDKILKTYGYEGESKDLQNYYNKNLKFHPKGLNMIYNLSKPINEFHKKREITKYLGEYASNSTMEFFAEFLTKLITDSINSETLLPTYNPLDKLNKYSTNLQNFFNSIFKLS